MKKILIILLFFICSNVKSSIAIMDSDSGRIIYSKNMNDKMLIASTTKIMTAIIALENGDLNSIYTISKEIYEVDGSRIYLKEKEKISLKDLLYGLMLQSGNDAAMTIASNVMNYDSFIKYMNIKAHILGMENTTFQNPHGLDDKTRNYSTAYDMALLMKYAISNKTFMKITQSKKYNNWLNKNKLLTIYKYATSGKIGYTSSSGQVFVSSASKNNKNLIIVTINEGDKFNLHKKLYEKYFNEYNKYKVLDKYTFSFKIKNNSNHYYIKNDINMLLKKEDIQNLNIKINLNKKVVYIYIGKELVCKEKIYLLKYEERKKNIKDLLLFWK